MRLKLVLATRREPTAGHVQILKAKKICSVLTQLLTQLAIAIPGKITGS